MKTITACRCCKSTDLIKYLDLGNQPLANSYHKDEGDLQTYPLAVNLCKSCFHSQLSVVVDPKIMFEHYLYVSSTTQTFRTHCKKLAENAVGRFKKDKLRVLDVACNDGLLLQCFKDLGCDVHGVDPSVNLREFTKEKGIPVEVNFWSSDVARKIGKFDIITATNVFAHVDDIQGFLKAIEEALTPDGIAVIEFPYCKDMIAKGEFDTVYHEHLSYFLVNSFSKLTNLCGFQILDIIETPIHGSSIRFFIKPGTGDCLAVNRLIEIEEEKGMLNAGTYKKFEEEVLNTKDVFRKLVETYAKTHTVIGYGASAKGNTMLNFFELDLAYIIDDNKLKWGYRTPGRDIPIIDPPALNDDPSPLAIVILSWNFSKEIISKIESVRIINNDVCLLYIPEATVLTLPLQDKDVLSKISG